MPAKPTSRILTVSAVIVLVCAGILWWDVVREGATWSGILLAALFTMLGVFWLLTGRRSGQPSANLDRPTTEEADD